MSLSNKGQYSNTPFQLSEFQNDIPIQSPEMKRWYFDLKTVLLRKFDDLGKRIDAVDITTSFSEFQSTVSTSLTELQAEIDSLQEQIDSLSGDVDLSTLQDRVDSLESTVSELNTYIGTVASDLGTHESSTVAHGSVGPVLGDSDIAPLEATVSGIESDLTTVQTDLSTVQTDLSTVQTDLSTVQTDLSTHTSETEAHGTSGDIVGETDLISLETFEYMSFSVSAADTESIVLQPHTDLANIAVDLATGAGTYTYHLDLEDTDRKAGDVIVFKFVFPASVNPTLEVEDAASSTLLINYTNDGSAKTVTSHITFDGTNWSVHTLNISDTL